MKIDEEYFNTLHRQRRELLDSLRTTKFTRLADDVAHQQIIPYASYSPWLDDADFQRVYQAVRSNTLVDVYRAYELWSLVLRTARLPGDVVEIGVWRGGTGAVLAAANAKLDREGRVCLFDTFSGVVKAVGGVDTLYKGGEHADTDAQVVRTLLDGLGLGGCEVIEGLFPEETGRFAPDRVRLCHVDVDTYGSAKSIMAFIWPRLVPGGLMVFDDYGFWGCEGVTRLLDRESPADSLLIHNINGHGILVKLSG